MGLTDGENPPLPAPARTGNNHQHIPAPSYALPPAAYHATNFNYGPYHPYAAYGSQAPFLQQNPGGFDYYGTGQRQTPLNYQPDAHEDEGGNTNHYHGPTRNTGPVSLGPNFSTNKSIPNPSGIPENPVSQQNVNHGKNSSAQSSLASFNGQRHLGGNEGRPEFSVNVKKLSAVQPLDGSALEDQLGSKRDFLKEGVEVQRLYFPAEVRRINYLKVL